MDTTQEITVLVRDREQLLQFSSADDWDAMTMLAAVSSDPRSFHELGLAWLRYRGDQPLEDLSWQPCDRPTFAGNWLLIDMACLRLVSNLEDFIPAERGAFQQTEGKWHPDIPVIWCNFPPWWQRSIASQGDDILPPIPPPIEPVDFRGILFGRAMADGLADRMLKIAESESVPAGHLCWDDLCCEPRPSDEQKRIASVWHKLTVRVHADWLMTPQDDLDSQTPRTFLHQGRQWVEGEVDNRRNEWSSLKRPPRALDRETYAYRHGPMGLDEVVVYFDLCREVIHAGWKLWCARKIDREELGREMWAHAKSWLASGSIDDDPTPPGEMIECSRRHMPQLADGTHLDCDCPVCRMMMDEADASSPAFSFFDGHHLELDNEFAFSLCETYEQWQMEQGQFIDFDEKCAETQGQNTAVDKEVGEEDELASVWKSSFVSDDAQSFVGSSPLTLGFRLAELISDLKMRQAPQEKVDALNHAFDAVRSAAYDQPLRHAAAAAMKDELELLAGDFPELTGKIADMQSRLDEWTRQRVDDDVPF